MDKTRSSFEQEFITFTGAEWNADPGARVISYHTALSVAAAKAENTGAAFVRALEIFKSEPDAKAKSGLIEVLDQTVLRHPKLFERSDPKQIYQCIIELYKSEGVHPYLPALAKLGLDIALQAANFAKQDIFNNTVDKIYHRIHWRSAEDYVPVLQRLDRLVSIYAWLATPHYAGMCCDLLYTVMPQEAAHNRYIQPHQRSKIKRYEDSLPAFYDTLKSNLLTLAHGVKEKRPGMLPGHELFTSVARSLLSGTIRLTLPTQSIARSVLFQIAPPLRENPPPYMQRLNPPPTEIGPTAKEFRVAHYSLTRRFYGILMPLSRPLRILAFAMHLRSAPCNFPPK